MHIAVSWPQNRDGDKAGLIKFKQFCCASAQGLGLVVPMKSLGLTIVHKVSQLREGAGACPGKSCRFCANAHFPVP
jgi:hypothetical protein